MEIALNLSEHKKLLYKHEQSIKELATLKRAQESRDHDWWIVSSVYSGEFELLVPREYAEKALQDRIWIVESQVKDQARELGLEGPNV